MLLTRFQIKQIEVKNSEKKEADEFQTWLGAPVVLTARDKNAQTPNSSLHLFF